MKKIKERRCRCAKKVGKSRNTVFCQCFVGSRGSKSRLAEAAGAEPAGLMIDEKIARVLWSEAQLEVKSEKN